MNLKLCLGLVSRMTTFGRLTRSKTRRGECRKKKTNREISRYPYTQLHGAIDPFLLSVDRAGSSDRSAKAALPPRDTTSPAGLPRTLHHRHYSAPVSSDLIDDNYPDLFNDFLTEDLFGHETTVGVGATQGTAQLGHNLDAATPPLMGHNTSILPTQQTPAIPAPAPSSSSRPQKRVGKYLCNECADGKLYPRKYELNRHVETKHRAGRWPCRYQGCMHSAFSRNDKLREHLRRSHGLNNPQVIASYLL